MANYVVRVTCYSRVLVIGAESEEDALERAMEEPDFGNAISSYAEIEEYNIPDSELEHQRYWTADYIVENE